QGAVAVVPVVAGKDPSGLQTATVARVSVVAGSSGTFDLKFSAGGVNYVAANLAYDIGATELQTRLNQAVGAGYSGIEVVVDKNYGGFSIRFGGATLAGKMVTVSADTTKLKASPFGTLFNNLDVDFDGTANVLLPASVELDSELVELGQVLIPGLESTYQVGNVEVRINSLKALTQAMLQGVAVSSAQIKTAGDYDATKIINYALPNLDKVYSVMALKNPLIQLIRNPAIIIDGIDYALKGIQKSLDAMASLPLPLIGSQLKKGTQFVGDFRSSVIAKISDFVNSTVDTYGGMDNALRQVLFEAFTNDSNGDGKIQAASLDQWLEKGEDAGDNPFLNFLKDYNGDNLITADDIVVEFLAMGLTGVANGTRLGYTLAGTKDDKRGDKKGGDVVNTLAGHDALQEAKALQFRMHLGQNLLSRDIDLSFDMGLPGLSLEVEGGVQLDLGWDFYLGFGVNTTDGLYLVSNMAGKAGLPDGQYVVAADQQAAYTAANPEIINPWQLTEAQTVKEISISFDAYLIGSGGGQLDVTNGATESSFNFTKGDAGTYTLSFSDGSKTYTTAAISRSASASQIQAALNKAVSKSYTGITVTAQADPATKKITGHKVVFAGDKFVGKTVTLSADAAKLKDSTQPASMTAKIFFLQGKLTDDHGNAIVGPDASNLTSYTKNSAGGLFDAGNRGDIGSRTWFHGSFAIDMIDRAGSNDGRITFGEMTRGKFGDLFKSEVTGKAQANFKMDLSIEGSKVLPRLVADFHLTWGLKNNPAAIGYDSLFTTSPQVWITELGIDVGSFFSDFLGPIVSKVQSITKPLQPIIDGLTTPIPGLSKLAGKDYTRLDLASDLGKGDKRIEFIKTFVTMLDLFNSIPVDAEGLIIPVGRVFNLAGDLTNAASRKGASLTGQTQDVNKALDTPKPAASSGSSTPAKTPSASGTKGFLDKLNNPNNAFKIPLLQDLSKVLDLIMGKPVDLVTYTPPSLGVGVMIDVGAFVFPGLKVGMRGSLDIAVNLTLGFDTSGIIKFIDSGNALDIFDGFYVSDNFKNGIDLPEIDVLAKLAIYGEFNAGVLRAGIEAGLKLKGEVDFWDEEGPGANDGKFRAKEIINALMCNPLNVVEASIAGSLYVDVYVKLFVLFGWATVFDKTLLEVDLFELQWTPTPCMPILASDDNGDGTWVLHMGSFDGANLIDVDATYGSDINKQARDRINRNIEDGDEKFVIKEIGNGEIEITATLDGVEYVKTYSGVKRILGYAGKGNDIIDASGLKTIQAVLVGGAGKDQILGGAKDDILIGGTGTTILRGNAGNDLLLARGGSTEMIGGSGSDSYRFLENWASATVHDD
ncbi:MAG: hypothetical protein ACRC02_12840, partial [Vogesella sp.]